MLAYFAASDTGVVRKFGESGSFDNDMWIGNYPEFKALFDVELTIEGGKLRLATAEEIQLRSDSSKAVLVQASDERNSAIYRAKTQEELDADLSKAAADEIKVAEDAAELHSQLSDPTNADRVVRAIIIVVCARLNLLGDTIKLEDLVSAIKTEAEKL